MIRDNLERDTVSGSVSGSVSISKEEEGEEDDEGDDFSTVSEAERNRILVEKMSQGQPERKRSYSASEFIGQSTVNIRNSGMLSLSLIGCSSLHLTSSFRSLSVCQSVRPSVRQAEAK